MWSASSVLAIRLPRRDLRPADDAIDGRQNLAEAELQLLVSACLFR